jgi:hypothetical protein
VQKSQDIQLDFVVDRLTNSIRNTISGDSFETEVARFIIKDTKQTTKKNGWNLTGSLNLTMILMKFTS